MEFKKGDRFITKEGNDRGVIYEFIGKDTEMNTLFLAPIYRDALEGNLKINYTASICFYLKDIDKYIERVTLVKGVI